MKTAEKKAVPITIQQQIKQIEEEIKDLKTGLKKPHFAKSSEQDYSIKSHIIDKQNQMIELLIKQSKKSSKK